MKRVKATRPVGHLIFHYFNNIHQDYHSWNTKAANINPRMDNSREKMKNLTKWWNSQMDIVERATNDPNARIKEHLARSHQVKLSQKKKKIWPSNLLAKDSKPWHYFLSLTKPSPISFQIVAQDTNNPLFFFFFLLFQTMGLVLRPDFICKIYDTITR